MCGKVTHTVLGLLEVLKVLEVLGVLGVLGYCTRLRRLMVKMKTLFFSLMNDATNFPNVNPSFGSLVL